MISKLFTPFETLVAACVSLPAEEKYAATIKRTARILKLAMEDERRETWRRDAKDALERRAQFNGSQ